jgi:hypothetical protein
MCAQTILNRIALPNAHDSPRIACVPDDVDARDVADGINIEIVEGTPMRVVSARSPR